MGYLPDANYVPKTLRDTVQTLLGGTNRLEVKGAQVRVPSQRLFGDRMPAEGNLGAVFARVTEHYMPHVRASWRSLLQHSNIFLGGLLSRHAWNPRQRKSWTARLPLCSVG